MWLACGIFRPLGAVNLRLCLYSRLLDDLESFIFQSSNHKIIKRTPPSAIAVSCGWAHTVYLGTPGSAPFDSRPSTNPPSPPPLTALAAPTSPSFYVTGKPHDFTTILRMNRLPSALSRMLAWMQVPPATSNEPLGGLPPAFVSSTPQEVSFEGIVPTSKLAASAGLTAFVGEDGFLYTFGVNNFGQCGVGENSNNIWKPSR